MSTYIKYCGYITDITGGTNSSVSGTNSSWDYNLVHISWQIKCPRTFLSWQIKCPRTFCQLQQRLLRGVKRFHRQLRQAWPLKLSFEPSAA